MTVVDVLGRVDELADGTGGSVDAVTGAAIGPYWKSRLRRGAQENLYGLKRSAGMLARLEPRNLCWVPGLPNDLSLRFAHSMKQSMASASSARLLGLATSIDTSPSRMITLLAPKMLAAV